MTALSLPGIVKAEMWKNTSSCWGPYWSAKPVKENCYSLSFAEPTNAYFVEVQPWGGVKESYEGPFPCLEDALEFQQLYLMSLPELCEVTGNGAFL